MEKPSLEQLDMIRKEGFRPGVVACIIHEEKILFFFKKEYKLWMLPQGGIRNKEDSDQALERTLREELGDNFVKNLNFEQVSYLDNDRMEFKPGKHSVGELKDDEGNDLNMIGKEYYFAVVESDSAELEIKNTEYDEYFWLTFQKAKFLADRIYQKGKRRITLKIISDLKNKGIIR
jgi:ADP-ribose pyrophosphatase YjhB (NUDIX family)